MSKLILEFSLPEEQEESQTAINASKYKMALDDIYNRIRATLKYGDHEFDEKTVALLEELRSMCFIEGD